MEVLEQDKQIDLKLSEQCKQSGFPEIKTFSAIRAELATEKPEVKPENVTKLF